MRARFLSACSLLVFIAWSSSIVAAPPETTATAKSSNAGAARSPDEIRDAIRGAMKRTNSMAERSVADRIDEPAVRELVDLYRMLETDTVLPMTERESLSSQVRIRLARIGKTIDRGLKRTAKVSTAKVSAAKSTASMANSTSVAAAKGGGPADHGKELLNIIKATIAPDSWDDAGGNGTIYYWPAWHVLVIRQTDEVHEQIEGLLKALR